VHARNVAIAKGKLTRDFLALKLTGKGGTGAEEEQSSKWPLKGE
jgi:hypothetical protein